MKLLCSTDWHLKFSSQFDRMTDEGLPSRLSEIIQSVKWTISVGLKEKCSLYSGTGDIFDTPERLNTKEGIAIKSMFDSLAKSFKYSFFIPGNHDQITSEINILELFSNSINVFSKPQFLDIDGSRLFFLPYMREAEDLKKAIAEFKTKVTPDKKYLFAHFWDKSVMPFDPEAVDLADLGLDFFDRVFLGHYHVPTADHNNKVIYVGTLLNKRFNETGPKGCWVVDLKKNTVKFHANPNSPEFVKCLDDSILSAPESIVANAYYKVYTSPENVTSMTKMLAKTKGFELVSKDSLDQQANENKLSLDAVEKRNSSSLKDFILKNCAHFLPEGVDEASFKARGEELLSGF